MGNEFEVWIIYLLGSGLAFFLGAALVLCGLVLFLIGSAGRGVRLTRNLLIATGAIFVAISAAPLPWWLYALLTVFTLLSLMLEGLRAMRAVRVASLCWLFALGMELPYHWSAELPPLGQPTLFVIGDSVSAGVRANEQGTWPQLLARLQNIDVQDFSAMGAKVGSAQQAERLGDRSGLVLLEIGGNDLLGSTTAEQFEEQLDQLLLDVCQHERTVVMLELPLPPFANRFGMIQRQLARKHDVVLVPRCRFIEVLTTPGATLDGIHLSPQGHALMAEMVWDQIRSAYSAGK